MPTPDLARHAHSARLPDVLVDALLEHSTAGVCLVTSAGLILRVNDEFCRLTGRSQGGLVGSTVRELISPELAAGLAEPEHSTLSQISITSGQRYVRPDGTATATISSLTAVDSQTALLVSLDTGGRASTTNQASNQSDALVPHADVLLASMTDPAAYMDREWRYAYVNPAAEALLGRPREQLLGRIVWDVFPGLRDHANTQALRTTMSERRPMVAEAASSLNGFWYQWRTYPTPDGGVTAIMHNIDARVRAEQALRASEERFRALANLVPALIWINDAQGVPRWNNERWQRYFGRTCDVESFLELEHLFHPSDWTEMRDRRAAAISAGRPVRLQQRFRRADGEYRWFVAQLDPIHDANGEVTQWFGVATDIDDQRKALDKAQRSRTEAELTLHHFRRVVAQLPIALAVFREPEHLLEVVSDLALELFPQLRLGNCAADMLSSAGHLDLTPLLDHVYKTGASAEIKHVEVHTARLGPRILEVKFHALGKADGEVYGIVAVVVDLTAMVKTQDELEAAHLAAVHARREAEQRREDLERILAHAPFAVCFLAGPRHVVATLNEMQRQFVGFTAGAGKPLGDIAPREWQQALPIIGQVFATGETATTREVPLPWKPHDSEAELGQFDMIYQPVHAPDGVVLGVLAFAIDVSSSVRAREAVADARDQAENAREHLRAILGAIPTAIAVARGEDFVYELANPAYLALVGHRDVVGQRVLDLFPELSDEDLADARHVLRSGEAIRRPEKFARYGRNADGSFYEGYFNAYLAPLRGPDGAIRAVITSTVEVTEHVRQRERIDSVRHEAEAARTELAQAHAQLERRIAERTGELARANAALAEENAASVRAEAARRDLLRRLASAQEDEQRRTARDLHDQVGQTLSALMVAIQTACDSEPLPLAAAARLRDALRLAEDLGRDVHDLATRLRPALLDDIGLPAALRQLLNGWQRRTGVHVDFQATWLDRERLPTEIETVVFRVVQEAMTNIARHARARRVSVIVERYDGHVIAVVEDDGVGFDQDLNTPGRLGLVGMQERVMLVGGTLDVESEPGDGTTVIARIPVTGGDAMRSGEISE